MRLADAMAPRRDESGRDRPSDPASTTEERAMTGCDERIETTGPSPVAVVPADADRTFRRLLVNSLISGVTSSFLWFALTFWVFLETRSVVVTGVIGG